MSFVMQSADDEQGQAWEHFYKSVCNVLRRSGAEDHFGKADYWVVDDNYGWRETHVEVHNLKMLAPAVIAHLRSLLAKDSAWQISVAVTKSSTVCNANIFPSPIAAFDTRARGRVLNTTDPRPPRSGRMKFKSCPTRPAMECGDRFA